MNKQENIITYNVVLCKVFFIKVILCKFVDMVGLNGEVRFNTTWMDFEICSIVKLVKNVILLSSWLTE